MTAKVPPILVNVVAIRQAGDAVLLIGTTEDGSPVLIAADERLVRDVTKRLAAGEGRVPISAKPWQILAGGAST